MGTFLELQNEVLAYGFDSAAYLSRVKTWLNQAQREVTRRLDLQVTENSTPLTLVAGTATYTLPVDFARIIFVNDSTDPVRKFTLEEIRLDEYQNRDAGNRAQPTNYAVEGGAGPTFTLFLWPTPDRSNYVINVRYIQLVTLMTGDSTTSGFNADYDKVLISYALSKAYGAEDDVQMSAFHRQEYERDLRMMEGDLNTPSIDTPRQVPGTRGFV